MPDPIPLHRQAGTRPAPGNLRLVDNRPDLYAALRKSRPSLFERIGDALASPRFIYAYIGFYAGCLATVGLAALWAGVGL